MNKILRVRIVHDSSAEDPRDWDDMCMILHDTRGASIKDRMFELVTHTDGWKAAVKMALAAGDESWMETDMEEELLYNSSQLDEWLERLTDEVIVKVFHTQHDRYIAWTTPDLCEKVGTPWDRAADCMAGSITTFKQWAEGDVYGFIVEECIDAENGDWIETDSCWGFYGSDIYENGMADCLGPELSKLAEDAEIEFLN